VIVEKDAKVKAPATGALFKFAILAVDTQRRSDLSCDIQDITVSGLPQHILGGGRGKLQHNALPCPAYDASLFLNRT
jgi:hypothetical protein